MTKRRLKFLIFLDIVAIIVFILAVLWYDHLLYRYDLFTSGTEISYTRLLNYRADRDKVLFNLANYYVNKGLSEKRPDLVRRAMEYYRMALRENPNLWQAKKNYELIARQFIQFEVEREIEIPGNNDTQKGERPSAMLYELDI